MALPATDTFSRTNSADLGTSWDVQFGSGFKVSSNGAWSNTGSPTFDTAESWNADSFNNDQYSQATTVNATGAGGASGLAVRVTANNYYGIYSDNTRKYLLKNIATSITTISSSTTVWPASSAVRLEITADQLRPMLTGVTDPDLGSSTQTQLTSGAAGLTGWGSDAQNPPTAMNGLDNWEGGNIVVPLAAAPWRLRATAGQRPAPFRPGLAR